MKIKLCSLVVFLIMQSLVCAMERQGNDNNGNQRLRLANQYRNQIAELDSFIPLVRKALFHYDVLYFVNKAKLIMFRPLYSKDVVIDRRARIESILDLRANLEESALNPSLSKRARLKNLLKEIEL